MGLPAQLVDRVKPDQRGVVAAALIGQAGLYQELGGEIVQGLEHLAPLDLLLELTAAEVPGFLLEGGDLVQAVVVASREQAHQLGFDAARKARLKPADDALALPV